MRALGRVNLDGSLSQSHAMVHYTNTLRKQIAFEVALTETKNNAGRMQQIVMNRTLLTSTIWV